MFRKKLTTNKYLFLITLCILINLLESWYFGLNWEAQSLAENICDWLTTIPFAVVSFWFFFSNDYEDMIKGQLVMFVMIMIYAVAYRLLLV